LITIRAAPARGTGTGRRLFPHAALQHGILRAPNFLADQIEPHTVIRFCSDAPKISKGTRSIRGGVAFARHTIDSTSGMAWMRRGIGGSSWNDPPSSMVFSCTGLPTTGREAGHTGSVSDELDEAVDGGLTKVSGGNSVSSDLSRRLGCLSSGFPCLRRGNGARWIGSRGAM